MFSYNLVYRQVKVGIAKVQSVFYNLVQVGESWDCEGETVWREDTVGR